MSLKLRKSVISCHKVGGNVLSTPDSNLATNTVKLLRSYGHTPWLFASRVAVLRAGYSCSQSMNGQPPRCSIASVICDHLIAFKPPLFRLSGSAGQNLSPLGSLPSSIQHPSYDECLKVKIEDNHGAIRKVNLRQNS